MAEISFFIPGKPQAKERARANRKTGAMFTPARTRLYESTVYRVAKHARELAKLEAFDGPVEVDFLFCFQMPKDWSRKKKDAALKNEVLCVGRMDVDNCIKAVLDGLQGRKVKGEELEPALIKNDNKVIRGKFDKRYAEKEGAWITVRELEQWDNKKHGQPTTWSVGALTACFRMPLIAGLTPKSK